MIPSEKKGRGQEKKGRTRNVVSQASLTPDILPVVNTLELTELLHAFALFKGTYDLLKVLPFVTKLNMKWLSNKNNERKSHYKASEVVPQQVNLPNLLVTNSLLPGGKKMPASYLLLTYTWQYAEFTQFHPLFFLPLNMHLKTWRHTYFSEHKYKRLVSF